MNGVPRSFEIWSRTLLPLGGMLALIPAATEVHAVFVRHTSAALATMIYDKAEIVAIGSVVASALYLVLFTRLLNFHGGRPFVYLPFEARWWEFIVFGFFSTASSLVLYSAYLLAVVLLPLVIPIKAIVTYSLGKHATLGSAVLAIPITYFGVALMFAVVYFIAGKKEQGNIARGEAPLFPLKLSQSYLPALRDVLFFSLSRMLGTDPDGLALTGALRWVGLAQAAIAKIVEVLIVGIGIALILGRVK